MQVIEVSFMRRRNLGNYEHAESMAKVSLGEGESESTAIALARSTVSVALAGPGPVIAKKAPVKKAVEPEVVAEAPVKTPPKKKAPAKKAPAKKVTQAEVLLALRNYAEAKDSKEMAAQVLHDVTGVKKLNEVEEKDFARLVKALAV